MVSLGQEWGRVSGRVLVGQLATDFSIAISADEKTDEERELEVMLTRGSVQGRRAAHRLYQVNGVRKLKKSLTGKLLTVVFRPEDMRLIEGSPSRRRDFLDQPLILTHPAYGRSLQVYQQTLIRRNKLLEQIRDRQAPPTTLTYWNLSLIKHGQILQRSRQELVEFLNLIKFDLPLSARYQSSLITA